MLRGGVLEERRGYYGCMKRFNNLSFLKDRRKDLRNNQTSQEIILWNMLRQRRLKYKFKRQHSVGPYILDFYCPEKRLAIELDGSQHLQNQDYDKERSDYLEEFNIKMLRFWNHEVDVKIDFVVEKIKEELDPPPAKGEGGGGGEFIHGNI
jgi:very-short-patch-repair endonuclease